jgi:hypothetical protein
MNIVPIPTHIQKLYEEYTIASDARDLARQDYCDLPELEQTMAMMEPWLRLSRKVDDAWLKYVHAYNSWVDSNEYWAASRVEQRV